MKKLKQKSGFSLIEMLIAVSILALLVMGIDTGMNAGNRVYNDSIFLSEASSLDGILNTTIGDMLRFSDSIRKNPSSFKDFNNTVLTPADVDFIFTNFEYGVRDAYFSKAHSTYATDGIVVLQNLNDGTAIEVVNRGSYPNLKVTNLEVKFEPQKAMIGSDDFRTGYCTFSYTIESATNSHLKQEYEHIVRLINDAETP